MEKLWKMFSTTPTLRERSTMADPKPKKLKFSSNKDALMMLPPDSDSSSPYIYYSHATQPGFNVRVSKPRDGKVERVYIHRYKTKDGTSTKEKDHKDVLAPVEPYTKAEYEDILKKLLKKREELKGDIVEGGSTRLTVAGAWAYYATEKFTNKDVTKEKDEEQFQRYLSHLNSRFLDELPRAFWSEYVTQLREGTLVVGTKTDKSGSPEPITRGPIKSSATMIGVLNTAALLYEIGNKFNGIRGDLKGQNPPGDLRKNVGTPNKKQSHIPLKDLGRAWRASNQLIAPWWRDLFRVFVLTGMRRSLVFGMRFDEIDFASGVYIIAPGKPGAKRKGQKITKDTPPIRLPLSKYVLNIIRARREFAPDPNGLVWFTPKPTRGRRTKKDEASLSDPRGAWTLLEWAIGDLHFSPHDIRRTFANTGSVATRDLFAVSLLMLHTGEELAKAAGVPGITIQYMNTGEAIDRMREAAEDITAYVLKLAAMPLEQAEKLEDPVLVRDLEDAVAEVA